MPTRKSATAPATKEAPEPRRRRAYLPANERRRLIIEAAQQVFARTNLQGARTRDIAKAAAVNQATLFEHFDSKEALFHAAVVEPMVAAMRGMHERSRAYVAAGSVDEIAAIARGSAQRQIEAMVEIFPLFTAALFSDQELGRKLYREQIMPLLKERSDALSGIVRKELDPEFVELANFGILFALAMNKVFTGKSADPETLARQLTMFATTGFVAEKTPKSPAKRSRKK